MDWQIRDFEAADQDRVIALWEACALTRPWNDPSRDIELAIREPNATILIGLSGGLILASLMIAITALNGWSLLHRRHWLSCIIMSCIECLSIPVGMLLGVSAILVLRRPAVREWFRATSLSKNPTNN